MAIPFRLRLAKAILGTRAKEFIPALNPIDGMGFGAGGRINTYSTKQDQITALKGWVFAANSAIADPCAAVEIKLYRRMKDGDREEVTTGKDMEILELLANPNAVHTGEQLLQLHYTYMNIVGESYIFMRDLSGDNYIPTRGRLPAALDIFPSHRVQFKLGETYSKSIVKMGSIEYPISSFIRDLNPDPGNPYMGRSIVAASAAVIDTDEQMKTWNQQLFANNARPSLIFQTNEALSDESYKRWKEQFYDEHTGTENAGKPLLIEGGKATPWMMTQQDLDFLASRKFTRDEILAMFRLSPGMIGSVENVNRANLEAGFYINAVISIVPRVRQFVRQLNATLVKVYDPTLELDFVNPVPEDEVAKLNAAKAGVNKWWTIDEVRDMYGEDPLPEGLGEQIVVPTNSVSLSSVVAPEAVDDTAEDEAVDDAEDAENIETDNECKSLTGVKKKI